MSGNADLSPPVPRGAVPAMSLLSHRADRGLANQLLAPLTLAAVLVLAVLGAVLTNDARDAAKDGLAGRAQDAGAGGAGDAVAAVGVQPPGLGRAPHPQEAAAPAGGGATGTGGAAPRSRPGRGVRRGVAEGRHRPAARGGQPPLLRQRA